ncbi:hypothetical protein Fmac_024907 [Flemingia macrophylla]|uniref:Uncharacterized protein n=1 Tax=Flemingia macrophylla TaxID=520843 RepID=A0ABD1LQR7_9FABA
MLIHYKLLRRRTDICLVVIGRTDATDSCNRFGARNDAIVIRGVHDVATNTSAESRKVEAKLDALVNLVTQLTVNQKTASVARVCGIRSSTDHHTNACPSSGVHDVATDTIAETRKVEGKLNALVNLVIQLAVNQTPASVARVCFIRSSNDHHTNVYPFSQQPVVNEHPEAYAANIYRRRPHKREARHLIEKMASNS